MTQVELYGWQKDLHLDAQGRIVRQPAGSVILEYNAWSSSNITTYIAATLLRDVIGVNVSVVEHPSTAGIYQRVATGVTDFVPEVWPENKEALYDSYIVQSGTVQDFGLIGFNGIFSLYVNGRAAQAQPDLVWIIWQSYRRGNPVLNYLPPFGTTPPARTANGGYLCDSETYPWCTNGMFIPPQCRPDPSQCRELWHLHPSYSLGSIEQFITTMNLSLVVVYLDDTPDSQARLLACGRQSTYACIFGYWEPGPLLAQESFLPVILPTSTPECWSKFDPKLTGTNQTEMRCGWSPHVLHKIGSPRLATQHPHIFQLLRYMSLKESAITSMLNDNSNGNSTEATACNWIKGNENLWSRWIQAPPEGFIRQVTALDLDNPLTILIYSFCCILCLVLAATGYVVVRWRKSVGVREHSPPFLLMSLAGLMMVVCSVAMEMHPPRTPVVCSLRVWSLSLGFTILLSGILVKTWRISRIFSNRQLYSKPLKNIHLFAAVLTLTAIDAALLAAWTTSSSPAIGYLPLSSSTVLHNCTYPTGDTLMATVITATLIVYQASLLCMACVFGYRIRNAATVGNESRYIAMSAYNIALIGLFVIPISFMPLNPLMQVAIKCLGVLLAVAINLSLLVLRSVVFVFVSRRPSLAIGQTVPRKKRGISVSMEESKGRGQAVGFGGLPPIRSSAFAENDSVCSGPFACFREQ
ncbi:7 transmembrane sweet-taste receptor of 3 GCPR-domain-containing protein [Catenaria anguillulae PL171]|uniref:7 transmembrane sweet-taste receptor of 3 GCPR-domain-containing protein n=1 Tax=Catenaria anguillulae PL171 TaxID=765915 RepID=A0A1Y2HMS3_9FUNG|nr:7 transmembrane sweet-taste receptor of 3 GCPR-domain-containing protein [Catenaria anguillulae PL171]